MAQSRTPKRVFALQSASTAHPGNRDQTKLRFAAGHNWRSCDTSRLFESLLRPEEARFRTLVSERPLLRQFALPEQFQAKCSAVHSTPCRPEVVCTPSRRRHLRRNYCRAHPICRSDIAPKNMTASESQDTPTRGWSLYSRQGHHNGNG